LTVVPDAGVAVNLTVADFALPDTHLVV